jgi:O-acetyl-ADP-ribose deacetylase (regulator of RNase III)
MNACKPVEKTFGAFRLSVVQGDITEQDTEAIVNAANNHLWMGGGVAGAIKRKGGAEIEQEAMRLGPIEPGAAVTTSAGRLKAKYCIHAAVMGQDLTTSAELITQATRSALIEAERLRIHSIAFPALGTGVGGFPLSACARLMLTAVISHCRTHEFPRLVRFVLFDANAYQTFVQVLSSISESR